MLISPPLVGTVANRVDLSTVLHWLATIFVENMLMHYQTLENVDPVPFSRAFNVDL